jgi:signal transduction histidine kinase
MPRNPPCRFRLRSLPFIGMLAFIAGADSAVAAAELSTAREVLDLTAEEAKLGLQVLVRGVVTYTDPSWAGQFFVQDGTGGVFVGFSGRSAPDIGSLVEVRGSSHPGAFAPFIEKPEWTVVGRAPLPEPRVIDMERFTSGVDDGLRVAVAGQIRRVFDKGDGRWGLIVASGGHRFEATVLPAGPDLPLPMFWVGARVRLLGVLAAEYQLHRRGLAMVRLHVSSSDHVFVERAEDIDPYHQDPQPLARVGQYRRDLAPGQRSRVRGVVVARLGGDSLAIEDSSGGLIVKGGGLDEFSPGDPVEAVGFEGVENFLPVLQDSRVTRLDEPRGLPPVVRPTVEDLALGRFHACLVGLEGDLIEVSERPAADGNGRGRNVVITLRAGGMVFKADFEDGAAEKSPLPFEAGSRVDLTGICLAEANSEGRVDSFRLHLSGREGVRVLRPAPWMNPGRTRIALGSTLAAVVFSGIFIASSTRKNRRLRTEIREREKLTGELEKARQQLALRVDERTEELNLEISARKESEVRFKAVIGERTRLAQELHDGIQQGLTGVALQLDAASRLHDRAPGQSQHHLELARNLMRQTQDELRNSVWNLRVRSREDFSLVAALRQSARRLTEEAGIDSRIEQSGHPAGLTELEEENLLRIGQEALTNAIKHAGPRNLDVSLDWLENEVVLKVRDDGCGFQPHGVAGPAEGHFGLSGMTERIQRIGGMLSIRSEVGRGTAIEARLPVIRGVLEPASHHHESKS